MDTEQRAIRAKQIGDDPIFREVMDGLRDAAIQSWIQTKTADASQRDFSWMMVKALDAIEARLQSIIDDQHLSAQASVRAPGMMPDLEKLDWKRGHQTSAQERGPFELAATCDCHRSYYKVSNGYLWSAKIEIPPVKG